MADDLTNPYAYRVAAQNAEWAQTFDAGTTNLAQRRRHQEDVADFEARDQAIAEQDQQYRLMTSKVAQDYERLKMERAKFDFEIETETELAPLRLQKEALEVRTAAAKEKERLATDALAHKTAEDEANDTTNFVAQISQFKRGTPGYMDALVKARLANPSMKNSLFEDIFKTVAPEGLTPAQALAQQQELQARAGENTSVSMDTTGKASFSSRQVKPEKPADLGTERTEYDEENKLKGRTVTKPVPASAPDPKITLAQRALDDPNASEAHKAAARRILGVK